MMAISACTLKPRLDSRLRGSDKIRGMVETAKLTVSNTEWPDPEAVT
jgi:hypothetical protein